MMNDDEKQKSNQYFLVMFYQISIRIIIRKTLEITCGSYTLLYSTAKEATSTNTIA